MHKIIARIIESNRKIAQIAKAEAVLLPIRVQSSYHMISYVYSHMLWAYIIHMSVIR